MIQNPEIARHNLVLQHSPSRNVNSITMVGYDNNCTSQTHWNIFGWNLFLIQNIFYLLFQMWHHQRLSSGPTPACQEWIQTCRGSPSPSWTPSLPVWPKEWRQTSSWRTCRGSHCPGSTGWTSPTTSLRSSWQGGTWIWEHSLLKLCQNISWQHLQ